MAVGRPLTDGEWGALSPGLATALRAAGAEPLVRAAAHPAARIAALWRGGVPILTRGDLIWWPRAAADLSAPGLERAMAVLQHELQHVLDYRLGRLTALRYIVDPREWTYRWRLGGDWSGYGAEQRAAIAESLWLMERGLSPGDDLEAVRQLVPWAAG